MLERAHEELAGAELACSRGAAEARALHEMGLEPEAPSWSVEVWGGGSSETNCADETPPSRT
ncbi:unnamed protein product [Prorocentrum cordatum]|uniref:Uncharacterized protein n=1 Tax=Prorocentrum cordatum TaxID=2364126 RepID=A0ABN9WXB3_9DINO|nr:unnamed protein product [Polarella glacialis]